MTKPRHAHDKDMCATKEFCGDKDIFVATDLPSSQKKK